MTTIVDGPAAGQHLMLKRSPYFLRVVEKDGKWDALDQLDDTPDPGEKIYVYKLMEKPMTVHINAGRGRSGWHQMAAYVFIQDQPADSEIRGTEEWRKWARGKQGGSA